MYACIVVMFMCRSAAPSGGSERPTGGGTRAARARYGWPHRMIVCYSIYIYIYIYTYGCYYNIIL